MYPYESCLATSRASEEPVSSASTLTTRACLAAILVCAMVAAMSPPARAQPLTAEQQEIQVEIVHRDLVVDPADSFAFTIRATVATETPYLEVRLRIYNPGGSLLYQKTEVRHDVPAGTTAVGYERELADLALSDGRYPVDVRVLATGADETHIEDRMLVMAPDRPTIPVSFFAHFSCTPARDTEGRFVIDPQSQLESVQRVLDVASLGRADTPIALALPPIMLDDWAQASAGYESVGTAGVVEVPADDQVPAAYRLALAELGEIVRSETVDLVQVPYAQPDLQGLQAMVAYEDLRSHLEFGMEVYRTSLEATPVPGVALAADSVPAGAVGPLAQAGIAWTLTRGDRLTFEPAAGISAEATPPPGVYHAKDTTLTALVVDDAASAAFAEDDVVRALADRLFDLAMSGSEQPVLAQVTFGPVGADDPAVLEDALEAIEAIEWADVRRVDAAGADETATVILPDSASSAAAAPVGYWSEVLEARRLSRALSAALGAQDGEAKHAVRQALLAQSRCWAGPDDSWGLADRGRAYAAAAVRSAEDILSGVTVSGEDITLAGRSGEIPISIQNSSNRRLAVTVAVQGRVAEVGPPDTVEYTLRPADNYLTLPVSMASALSDRLSVEVRAGEEIIASTTIRVRASYLDRLAIVGSVVLVLLGLLFYIRRRVMT
jgi:hypothetical protein